MKKTPNLIDVEVGLKIRFKREELGLTQADLGEKIGTSYQQVQKYENAANRVSASKLFEVSKALGVDVDYFFNKLSKGPGGKGKNNINVLLKSKKIRKMLLAFMECPPAVRKEIYNNVIGIGNNYRSARKTTEGLKKIKPF